MAKNCVYMSNLVHAATVRLLVCRLLDLPSTAREGSRGHWWAGRQRSRSSSSRYGSFYVLLASVCANARSLLVDRRAFNRRRVLGAASTHRTTCGPRLWVQTAQLRRHCRCGKRVLPPPTPSTVLVLSFCLLTYEMSIVNQNGKLSRTRNREPATITTSLHPCIPASLHHCRCLLTRVNVASCYMNAVVVSRYAAYDGVDSCTDFKPFGGWSSAFAHQRNDTDVGVIAKCKISADLNTIC